MPLSCLDKICQGIASCGEWGSHGGHSAFAGGRCPTCIPSKGQAVLGEESGAGQTQRQGWKHHRVLCRATGEPGRVQSLCHAHDLAMRVTFNKNVRKEKRERKKEQILGVSSLSCHPVAGPRFFSAGRNAWPQPPPGGPREPGRGGRTPLQPPWSGRCTSLSPGSLPLGRCQARPRRGGTGEEGQYGHGSSLHALQPLKLRARKGLLLATLCSPLGSPLSLIQPFPPSLACA